MIRSLWNQVEKIDRSMFTVLLLLWLFTRLNNIRMQVVSPAPIDSLTLKSVTLQQICWVYIAESQEYLKALMFQKRFLKHDNRQINITVDPLTVNAENCFPKIKNICIDQQKIWTFLVKIKLAFQKFQFLTSCPLNLWRLWTVCSSWTDVCVCYVKALKWGFHSWFVWNQMFPYLWSTLWSTEKLLTCLFLNIFKMFHQFPKFLTKILNILIYHFLPCNQLMFTTEHTG